MQAKECGFLEVRRTYTHLLKTSKIDSKQVFPEFNGQDICVQNLSSISGNKELKFKLINRVKENYEKTHIVNPVGIHNSQKWEELIFNEDTVQRGSFIVLKNSEILAYSLLHYSNTPNQLEFGWRGTNENTDLHLILYKS